MRLFSKLKQRKVDSMLKRTMPSWVTYVPNKNEYRVQTRLAFPLFMEALGVPVEEMNPQYYHACRRGVANYVAKRSPVKGVIRLLKGYPEWIQWANIPDETPSFYRKAMDRFDQLVKSKEN